MPDWNSDKLSLFRNLICRYVSSLNSGNFHRVSEFLADEISISRGKTVSGKEEVLSYFRNLLSAENTGRIQFELLDASMGFFNDREAQILLYMQIFQNGNKREVHIESLFLSRNDNCWLISRIFGLGFDPDQHSRYFKPFLDAVNNHSR